MNVKNQDDLLAAILSSYLTSADRGRMLNTAESKANVAVLEVNGKVYKILAIPYDPPRMLSPQERVRKKVMATGNRWAIENFIDTHC